MAPGSPKSGVGRIIAGRYRLLDQVGSGGMGHVWLAHDQRLDCDVALKEIRFRNLPDGGEEHESRIARARAEARHAAVLRGHPHVVTVHDVLEHEGLPWIVMEYVAGAEDLRDWLARRGPLAPAECARMGLAVLDALTAGHERGIMHRDVKPANILLAPDRTGMPGARILLTDYGISVQPDSPETRWTRTSILVGTAGYLAPERTTGGPATAAADLFSLGCTLYFGVEGFGPFDRGTDLAAITAVVLEEAPPPRRAGALWPVVEALLIKDPARRISAEDAAAALARIITPEPHPPTQVDTGSQPPWARLVTSDGASGPGMAPPDERFGGPAQNQSTGSPARNQSSSGPAQDQGLATPAAYTPTAQAPGPYAPTAQAPGPYAPTAQAPGAYAPRPGQELGRSAPSTPQPGPGFGPPWYGAPPGPVTGPSGRRRRKRPRVLQALAAVLLALGLTAGGVWYAMAHKVVLPYGDTVGLSEPLRKGDCVVGDPSPGSVAGVPRLTLDPSCGNAVPDGQVMALYKAPSFEVADRQGADRCEELTKGTAERLAWNVRSMAVVPTRQAFHATGGNVACLLVGKHGPMYGPLGKLRPYGMTFKDATQIQRGDCLGHEDGDALVYTHYQLVACDKNHVGLVIQITHLKTVASGEDADAQANDQCAADAPPEDFGRSSAVFWSHGLRSTGLWAKGYYLVVCSLEHRDKSPLQGNE
ncbi:MULTISPECIES: protein kinase domain-containing protein [unclassified Streptomyces]|uniref:serine/threonine-protein kinase n=1 Tax=unclassified Streptomyces TaxID=2593676 RepID=UPI002E80EDC8|nr:protein kinase [Streptomyces sp. NBC_00589]WTI40984.1 protein kinase [Streptomyces sp. NBC_00775]WUB25332.1 protein kinase [Streptomyces sp. NBC_00589]